MITTTTFQELYIAISTFKLIVIFLASLLTYTLFDFFLIFKKLYHLPGPNALIPPNVFKGITLPVKYFKEMVDKYGPIYVYWPGWIFTSPMVFICDVKAMRQIMTDVKTFTKGPDYTVRLAYALGDGMVTKVGAEHNRMRSNLMRFFVKKNVDKLIPGIQRNALKILTDLNLTKNGPDGSIEVLRGDENFDIMYYCHALTLRSICHIVYGKDVSYDLEYEKACMHDISYGQRIVGTRIFFKAPMVDWDPPLKHIKSQLRKWYPIMDKEVEDRKQKYRMSEKTKCEEPDDILKALVDAGYSRMERMEQIQTIIFAGFETTSTFLSYAFYRLAKYGEVQERVRKEIFEVLGNREELTADDLPKFRYLNCVFKECMRWLSIIPAITRLTTKDANITTSDGKSYLIPEGVDVIIPFYLFNFNSDIWDNPNKFDPDRMTSLADLQSIKHGFLPFSYGVRSCVGNILAFNESIVAVVHILRRFKLERAKGFKPRTTLGISTVSSNGMRIKMVPLQ